MTDVNTTKANISKDLYATLRLIGLAKGLSVNQVIETMLLCYIQSADNNYNETRVK